MPRKDAGGAGASSCPTCEEQVIPPYSAGGVVLRGRGRALRVAVMFSQFGTWVLPKGGIRPAETPEHAAERELQEEVGLTGLELKGELGWTEHDFEMYGRRHRKRVYWFLFLAPDDAEVHPHPEQGALDVGWFTQTRALRLLTHADQRRMLRRALKLPRGGCPPGEPCASPEGRRGPVPFDKAGRRLLYCVSVRARGRDASGDRRAHM